MRSARCRQPGGGVGCFRAFTLLELLVVMATITLLLSLLLPGLTRLRQGAKSIKCMANLRVVAFDFQLFANETFAEDRGDSSRLANGTFRFEDFVERQYKVDEFWESDRTKVQLLDSATSHMLCPSVSEPLHRVPDRPCSSGAILPAANVGYSFNARLFRQTKELLGRPSPDLNTLVRSSILQHPTVPIAFDVDGDKAHSAGKAPYFTAPPIEGYDDIYAGGSLWFPAYRHSGRMNVILVGGYVRSISGAANRSVGPWPPGWDWKYQPDPIE